MRAFTRPPEYFASSSSTRRISASIDARSALISPVGCTSAEAGIPAGEVANGAAAGRTMVGLEEDTLQRPATKRATQTARVSTTIRRLSRLSLRDAGWSALREPREVTVGGVGRAGGTDGTAAVPLGCGPCHLSKMSPHFGHAAAAGGRLAPHFGQSTRSATITPSNLQRTLHPRACSLRDLMPAPRHGATCSFVWEEPDDALSRPAPAPPPAACLP